MVISHKTHVDFDFWTKNTLSSPKHSDTFISTRIGEVCCRAERVPEATVLVSVHGRVQVHHLLLVGRSPDAGAEAVLRVPKQHTDLSLEDAGQKIS